MLLFILNSFILYEFSKHFNTSHVTVYRRRGQQYCGSNGFQYISCYCLSWGKDAKKVAGWNFNTSHVTVYPVASIAPPVSRKFQYISCYCLSVLGLVLKVSERNFNTSHVTVYLTQLPGKIWSWLHFNTSHVTVYLPES